MLHKYPQNAKPWFVGGPGSRGQFWDALDLHPELPREITLFGADPNTPPEAYTKIRFLKWNLEISSLVPADAPMRKVIAAWARKTVCRLFVDGERKWTIALNELLVDIPIATHRPTIVERFEVRLESATSFDERLRSLGVRPLAKPPRVWLVIAGDIP